MDSTDRHSPHSDKIVIRPEDLASPSSFAPAPNLDLPPIANVGSAPFGPPARDASSIPWRPLLAIGGAALMIVAALGVGVLVSQQPRAPVGEREKVDPEPDPAALERQRQDELKRQQAAAVAAVMQRFAPIKSKLEKSTAVDIGVEPEIVDNAVAELRGIDLSMCPKDFQQDFWQYIHACESLGNVMARAKSDPIMGVLADLFITRKFENTPASMKKSYDAIQAAYQQLYDTGRAVEQTAMRYY
jgi:hypothetical protein